MGTTEERIGRATLEQNRQWHLRALREGWDGSELQRGWDLAKSLVLEHMHGRYPAGLGVAYTTDLRLYEAFGLVTPVEDQVVEHHPV